MALARVGDITNRDVISLADTATAAHAIAVLKERFVGAIAVVNDQDAFVGLVSTRDLLGQASAQTLRALMTPLVSSIDVGVPVKTAARLMADCKLHHLFVEEAGQVVGIVSLTDIARLVGEFGVGDQSDNDDDVRLADVIRVDHPRALFLASIDRCGAELGTAFYRRFLASSPDVKARFAKTDMETQQRKIVHTLRLAADVVTGDAAALNELTRQAERHSQQHLNIRPELYEFWLEAIIGAVAECDPRYDRIVEHAWRLLMGHVIRHMIRRF